LIANGDEVVCLDNFFTGRRANIRHLLDHKNFELIRHDVVEPILLDLNVVAAKTGMLPTGEIVSEVARLFRETKLPAPVVDPVMVSTSGFDLIADDAFLRLKSELLVLSRVVTPNIPEAERLTGLRITNTTDMWHAAQAIRELGVRAVLIKGGHLREQNEAVSREAIDILDDGGEVTVFRGEWIYAAEVHGTGCTLSAAIAACLGRGMELKASVSAAKKYVTETIRRANITEPGAVASV